MFGLGGIAAGLAVRWGVPRWLIVAGAIFVAFGLLGVGTTLIYNSIWNQGYAAAEAKWIEKALEAQITKLKQELEAARRSKESDDRHDAELEAEMTDLQKKVKAYEELLKQTGDYCPLGDGAVGLR